MRDYSKDRCKANYIVKAGRVSMDNGLFGCLGETSLPLGPFSGYTRGQTTQRQTSLPLGPFSGYTGEQTTQRQTSLPLESFSGYTSYREQTRDRQAFPRTLLRVHHVMRTVIDEWSLNSELKSWRVIILENCSTTAS